MGTLPKTPDGGDPHKDPKHTILSQEEGAKLNPMTGQPLDPPPHAPDPFRQPPTHATPADAVTLQPQSHPSHVGTTEATPTHAGPTQPPFVQHAQANDPHAALHVASRPSVPGQPMKTADASMAHKLKTQGPRFYIGLRNYAGGNVRSTASYKDEEGKTHELTFIDGVVEVKQEELEYFADESRFIVRIVNPT